MVTGPLTSTQALPSNHSSVPVVSTPIPAVALTSTGLKLTGWVERLSRLTMNSAYAPSLTDGLDTLSVGRSSSRTAPLSGVPLVLPG